MSRAKLLAFWLVLAFFAYCGAASVVFKVRHPWATDTETWLWAGSALRLEKVPYDVMRPREGK